jgi:hypothetical protein
MQISASAPIFFSGGLDIYLVQKQQYVELFSPLHPGDGRRGMHCVRCGIVWWDTKLAMTKRKGLSRKRVCSMRQETRL